MDQAQDAFDGVAFHCYAGSVNQQDDFHSRYPTKEIYLTECAGTIGSDWWTDIKWYMDNLFIGSIEYHSHTALMWNIAGDSSGGPKLPGTNSCSNPGCRPVVTVNDNGTYNLNQECTSRRVAFISLSVIAFDFIFVLNSLCNGPGFESDHPERRGRALGNEDWRITWRVV